MDLAMRRLAEWDDARVKTVDQCAERQKIQGALLLDIQTSAHDGVIVLLVCPASGPAGPVHYRLE
jgi:hypothetical protein